MTARVKADVLALKVSRVFHDFLMDTDAGREVRAGKVEGKHDPHLITALSKIVTTTPRSTGERRVGGLTVAELDALEPPARLMGGIPGNAGAGPGRTHWLASKSVRENIAHLREVLAAADPSQVSKQRYPLHNRLRIQQPEADMAVRLLDWLMSPASPVTLAEPDPRSRRGTLRRADIHPRDLVLAYLEIDPDELAQEALRLRQHLS